MLVPVIMHGLSLPASTGSEALMTNCSVVVVPSAESVVRCTLPAGHGNITQVSLTVLDQKATIVVEGIAYDPPTISSTLPSPIRVGTDMVPSSVTLFGSGFGVSAGVVQAYIVVDSNNLCNSSTLLFSSLSVTSSTDASVRLQLQASLGSVFANALIVVVVAGQFCSVPLTVLAPFITGLSLVSSSSGHTIDISGTNFGSVVSRSTVSNCTSPAAVVDIDGKPCDDVSVVTVCCARVHLCLKCIFSSVSLCSRRTSRCAARRMSQPACSPYAHQVGLPAPRTV